jgi:hypothetical protein
MIDILISDTYIIYCYINSNRIYFNTPSVPEYTYVRFFKSNFLTLTKNIPKNKLFQTEKATYYNSWFHNKSTNIIFILLASMITLLFVVKIN